MGAKRKPADMQVQTVSNNTNLQTLGDLSRANLRGVLVLLCLLASTAGAYDFKGVEPGKDVEAARSAGLECMYSKCTGGVKVLDFGGTLEATYTDSGTVTEVKFLGMPHRYAALRAALIEKYGKPTSSLIMPKMNAYGARVDSHVDTWQSADGIMVLDEYAGLQDLTITIRRVEGPRLNAGI